LDTYITEYEKDEKETYYAYDDIEITTPNLIQDFITNGDFRSGESGWSTTVGLTSKQKEDKNYDKVNYCPEIESIAIREVSNNNESIFYTLAQDYFSGNYSEKITYSPAMIVDFKGISADLTAGLNSNTPYGILINSGLYDSRINLSKITDGTYFTLEYEYVPVSLNLVNEEIVNYETNLSGAPYYDPLHLFIVSYDDTDGATATGFDTALSG
jgi:hypothetical protein